MSNILHYLWSTERKIIENIIENESTVVILSFKKVDSVDCDDMRKETRLAMRVSHVRSLFNWVFRKFANPNKSNKTNKTKVHQIVLFGLLDSNNTIWWTKQKFNKMYYSQNYTIWWIFVLFVLLNLFGLANFLKTQMFS